MAGPALRAGTIVAGKIAEQVAIQAAAELLLRKLLPGRSKPDDNPIADLELSGLMNAITAQGGMIEAKPKRKKRSRFNTLLKEEMKKSARSKKSAKVRFSEAAKRASRKLAAERKTKKRRSK